MGTVSSPTEIETFFKMMSFMLTRINTVRK